MKDGPMISAAIYIQMMLNRFIIILYMLQPMMVILDGGHFTVTVAISISISIHFTYYSIYNNIRVPINYASIIIVTLNCLFSAHRTIIFVRANLKKMKLALFILSAASLAAVVCAQIRCGRWLGCVEDSYFTCHDLWFQLFQQHGRHISLRYTD